MIRLEKVVRSQRLASVILRVEYAERLVDVVRHDPDQLALLAKVFEELASILVQPRLDSVFQCAPHLGDGVVAVAREKLREAVARLVVEQRDEHPQGQQALLTVDDIKDIVVSMQDHRA
jgi:hypothetical protein